MNTSYANYILTLLRNRIQDMKKKKEAKLIPCAFWRHTDERYFSVLWLCSSTT